MPDSEHTPLPLVLKQDAHYIVGRVGRGRPGGEVIAEVRMTRSPSLLSDRDRAELAGELVSRWNLHEALVEALRAAMDYIDKFPCDPDIYNDQFEAWQKLQSLDVSALLERVDGAQGREQ